MNKRLAWIAAVLALASCTSPAKRDCERTTDCANDEFCRMGFCVPAVARDDTSMGNAQSDTQTDTTRPPRDTGGGRTDSDTNQPTDGGGRDIDRCDGRAPGPEDLIVNEILVDVPGGYAGDANGDGTRDAFADEFVEVVSRTDDRLDLSGVELLEGGEIAATLGSTCLAPRSTVVVFGGGSVESVSASDDALFRTADGRLGLPNSGGTFAIRRDDGTRLAEVQWNGPPSESLTLQPQIMGTSLKPHSTVAPGRKISPGRCADGSQLTKGCPKAGGPDAGDAGRADEADRANGADAEP
ncbi:MAG: lamin tail domain-containing protein [Bradymonadaceae bacterium]